MPPSPDVRSLKERFTSMVEGKIISGEWAVGCQLPPERELAAATGISRIIVHAGLVELAARKVLRIVPRRGAFVADYRSEPSLELYNALIRHTGVMNEELFRSLVEFRDIMESNCARLAACNAEPADLDGLRALVVRERAAACTQEAVLLDYEFHIRVATATKNVILPMAMRSTETLYKRSSAGFIRCFKTGRMCTACRTLWCWRSLKGGRTGRPAQWKRCSPMANGWSNRDRRRLGANVGCGGQAQGACKPVQTDFLAQGLLFPGRPAQVEQRVHPVHNGHRLGRGV